MSVRPILTALPQPFYIFYFFRLPGYTKMKQYPWTTLDGFCRAITPYTSPKWDQGSSSMELQEITSVWQGTELELCFPTWPRSKWHVSRTRNAVEVQGGQYITGRPVPMLLLVYFLHWLKFDARLMNNSLPASDWFFLSMGKMAGQLSL